MGILLPIPKRPLSYQHRTRKNQKNRLVYQDCQNIQELQLNEQRLRLKITALQNYRKYEEAQSRKQVALMEQQNCINTPNMTAYSKFSKLDVDQVTYDSNGKVMQLPEVQKKKKMKKYSLYEIVSYNMNNTEQKTRTKSKTKITHSERKQDNFKFKNDKEFLQKIQKYHDIKNTNQPQKKQEVFMTSIKIEDYKFSHPKIDDKNYKNNKANPWVIKPGIKVHQNGKLVFAQNRVSQQNKMSLYSFNQKVQQEYKEYLKQQGDDLQKRVGQPRGSLQSRPRFIKTRGSVSSKSTVYRQPTQPNEKLLQNKHILKFPSLPKANQGNGTHSVRTIQSYQRPPSGKTKSQIDNNMVATALA